MTKHSSVLVLNALLIFVICGVLLGAYDIQFFHHEQPCPLCLLQRLAMIGIACGALMNLRFGIQPLHYGISLLSLTFGASVSLRHIALHICPQMPPAGEAVLGFHLYVWAFLVFGCSLLAITIMLMLYDKKTDGVKPKKMSILFMLAFAILLITTFTNVITTFLQCKWGVC